MYTDTYNRRGEPEKVEFQQAQTRLHSAVFRRHDITQRGLCCDDLMMSS
jgi:hypothetical protein